ncbi:MAG: response regulator transcription factor [Treponema sp.]|jgi:DNA-binding NarL/FixJ family response regulator|nr:response regulator transcription factor [Treponema sp.]
MKTMNNIISILIASRQEEDQKRIMAALSEQTEFFITSVEKDETGVIIRTERLKPDVLILDLQLSGTTGIELVNMIIRRSPSTAIIVFCVNKDDKENMIYASLMLKAGISGLLFKDEDMDKLAHIVKIVNLNGCYINKTINNNVYNEFSYKNQFPGQLLSEQLLPEQLQVKKFAEQARSIFSPLELGIITQMAKGFSDVQIAEYLNYNEGTIKNCLTVIKRKTKLKNRIQIVVLALVSGLVQLDDFSFDVCEPES